MSSAWRQAGRSNDSQHLLILDWSGTAWNWLDWSVSKWKLAWIGPLQPDPNGTNGLFRSDPSMLPKGEVTPVCAELLLPSCFASTCGSVEQLMLICDWSASIFDCWAGVISQCGRLCSLVRWWGGSRGELLSEEELKRQKFYSRNYTTGGRG